MMAYFGLALAVLAVVLAVVVIRRNGTVIARCEAAAKAAEEAAERLAAKIEAMAKDTL